MSPSPTPPPPPPAPQEVFAYHDGERPRYADPHRVRRLLHARLGGTLDRVIREANGRGESDDSPPVPPGAWSDAWDRLCEAICEAFAVPPFDPHTGQGFGDERCRELLTRFFTWEADVKKKRGPSPTASRPTAPATSPARPRSGTACGST